MNVYLYFETNNSKPEYSSLSFMYYLLLLKDIVPQIFLDEV